MSSTTAPAAGEKAGGKSKLTMILIVVILLLLVGGGGGGFYLYKQMGAAHQGPVVAPPPVFFPLDPFTVNLAGGSDGDDSDSHYLHLGLTLKLATPESKEKLTEYLPEVRSRILLLLSSKKPEDLATVAGKTQLSTDIAHTLEKPYASGAEAVKVTGVLLTDFVIQ